MRELFFFRHGETDFNAQGRFQGHLDVPLNEVGRGQARALGQRLKASGFLFDLVLTSDLTRARETAEIVVHELTRAEGDRTHGIAGPMPVPRVIPDPRFREAMLGEAQGHTWQEMGARFGEEIARRWRSDHPTDADVSFPGGETGAQVLARVSEGVVAHLAGHPLARRIAVSCHGGVIRRFMHAILPVDADPVEIPNGVVYRVLAPTPMPVRGVWQVTRI